jgi:rubrerythrin
VPFVKPAHKSETFMDDVNVLLRHAIQLERDAARRYEDLAHSMRSFGNVEVERLFRKLGDLSRRHLALAVSRSGFHDLPEMKPEDFQWPDGITPEAAGWRGVDGALDVLAALELALEGEESGYAYYAAVANTAKDPEVITLAGSFAEEEEQHVAELKRWIERASASDGAR